MVDTVLTLVIPTCRRPDLLAACLAALEPQRARCAAVVTDDGDDDVSARLVAARFPWASWQRGPRRGPAANRNAGARAATTPWIAFVDDDCVPRPGFTAALLAAVGRGGAEVLEGCTITPDKVDSPFREGIENTTGGVFWSCNLAVERAFFERIGGFDEDFTEAGGEDMEFAHRFQRLGGRARFVPDAVVDHPVRRVGLRKLLWKLRLSRWTRLYHLKTRPGAHPELGYAAALWTVAREMVPNQLRFTWWFVRAPRDQRRTRLFNLAWGWLHLPWLVPYNAVWERRYRRMLARRREGRA